MRSEYRAWRASVTIVVGDEGAVRSILLEVGVCNEESGRKTVLVSVAVQHI